eukprot:COSAG01_NODE_2127_length_8365_cov_5.420276_11_plen_484_part_00
MRTIKRKTQKPDMLSGITYTVCGLGDTNYNKFCHTGITLDTRMAQLGAERFYDMCCADDGTGMDKDIEPWTQGLWTPLRVACGLEKAAAAPAPAPVPLPSVGAAEGEAEPEVAPEAEPEVAPEAAPEAPPAVVAAASPLELQVVPCEAAAQEAGATPDASTVAWAAVEEHFGVAGRVFGAPLCGARRLTTPDAVKCVWHAELDVCAEPCDFQPGDALGILCPNPAEEVSALAARLGLELGSWVQLRPAAGAAGGKVEEELPAHLPPAPCTVGALLTHCVEIRRVSRKALLLALSASCADAAEAATLSLWASKDAAGRQAYKAQIMAAPPTLLELLQAFPSAAPSLGALLLQLALLLAAAAPSDSSDPPPGMRKISFKPPALDEVRSCLPRRLPRARRLQPATSLLEPALFLAGLCLCSSRRSRSLWSFRPFIAAMPAPRLRTRRVQCAEIDRHAHTEMYNAAAVILCWLTVAAAAAALLPVAS